MKLGVFTAVFGGQPFEDALDYVKSAGLDAVEIGTGNYPGDAHCDLDKMLKSKDEVVLGLVKHVRSLKGK